MIIKYFFVRETHLEFPMVRTNMSVAPQLAKSSMTIAIFFFSTMLLTATQSASSI